MDKLLTMYVLLIQMNKHMQMDVILLINTYYNKIVNNVYNHVTTIKIMIN